MRKDYKKQELSFNRRAVIASASITSKTNTIHSITEIDITIPRKKIKDHFKATGEKLSFTAYIVHCLSQTISLFPEFNSFIKGRSLITLDNVTINVLIEREIEGEKVPEPLGIKETQKKNKKGPKVWKNSGNSSRYVQ